MTTIVGSVTGLDFTLPNGPPLVAAPLSLVDLARPLIDVPDAVAAEGQALEDLATAQRRAEELKLSAAEMAADGLADAAAAAAEAASAGVTAAQQAEAFASERSAARAAAERWAGGFQYLPELGVAATSIYVPGSGATKGDANNQSPFLWYDPFVIAALDARSTIGVPWDQRVQRARRALLAHEPWRLEREFWTGASIPTNYHLAASPLSTVTSPHRTITGWADPTPASGTTLGTAVGLRTSLAALDQSIADSDAGTGMIHATPYLVQLWSSVYPFLRDNAGRLLTVNLNLIVPGYGYPGSGPDDPSRSVADGATNSNTTVTSATAAFTQDDVGHFISGTGIPAGAYIVSVTNATTVVISAAATATATGVTITVTPNLASSREQWAFATDMVYKLRGPVTTYPRDLGQEGMSVYSNNEANVRAERPWALITNQLLRAAVLVDTTLTT